MNGKHTILIEINGEACSGFAYQTQGGILIHLPSIQALHAPAFETLFQPLPEERLNGGFIEVGEWDGSAFPFEGDVLFGLGPDGAVWAKVCDSPEELPLATNESTDPSTTLRLRTGEGHSGQVASLAWRMLAEAEEAFSAKSMARQRAAEKYQPAPRTILDFLKHLEDESKAQEEQASDDPDEITGRKVYTTALRGLAQELRDLGFEPATQPTTQGDIL